MKKIFLIIVIALTGMLMISCNHKQQEMQKDGLMLYKKHSYIVDNIVVNRELQLEELAKTKNLAVEELNTALKENKITKKVYDEKLEIAENGLKEETAIINVKLFTELQDEQKAFYAKEDDFFKRYHKEIKDFAEKYDAWEEKSNH